MATLTNIQKQGAVQFPSPSGDYFFNATMQLIQLFTIQIVVSVQGGLFNLTIHMAKFVYETDRIKFPSPSGDYLI